MITSYQRLIKEPRTFPRAVTKPRKRNLLKYLFWLSRKTFIICMSQNGRFYCASVSPFHESFLQQENNFFTSLSADSLRLYGINFIRRPTVCSYVCHHYCFFLLRVLCAREKKSRLRCRAKTSMAILRRLYKQKRMFTILCFFFLFFKINNKFLFTAISKYLCSFVSFEKKWPITRVLNDLSVSASYLRCTL